VSPTRSVKATFLMRKFEFSATAKAFFNEGLKSVRNPLIGEFIDSIALQAMTVGNDEKGVQYGTVSIPFASRDLNLRFRRDVISKNKDAIIAQIRELAGALTMEGTPFKNRVVSYRDMKQLKSHALTNEQVFNLFAWGNYLHLWSFFPHSQKELDELRGEALEKARRNRSKLNATWGIDYPFLDEINYKALGLTEPKIEKPLVSPRPSQAKIVPSPVKSAAVVSAQAASKEPTVATPVVSKQALPSSEALGELLQTSTEARPEENALLDAVEKTIHLQATSSQKGMQKYFDNDQWKKAIAKIFSELPEVARAIPKTTKIEFISANLKVPVEGEELTMNFKFENIQIDAERNSLSFLISMRETSSTKAKLEGSLVRHSGEQFFLGSGTANLRSETRSPLDLFEAEINAGRVTFVMFKSDAVLGKDAEGVSLVPQMLNRLKELGFDLAYLGSQTRFSQEQAKEFYAVHQGKWFFEPLVEYITSGPVVPVLLRYRGEGQAVEAFRKILPALRGEFGVEKGNPELKKVDKNKIHASDSIDNIFREGAIAMRSELRGMGALIAAGVTVKTPEEFFERNHEQGGGYEQGVRSVTEKITDGVWSLWAHAVGAADALSAIFLPRSYAQTNLNITSQPGAFSENARFYAAKAALGVKTFSVGDVLVIGRKFALEQGAIAAVRTVFGDMPVLVYTEEAEDLDFLEQLNAQLDHAQRPKILVARNPEEAKEFLSEEVRRLSKTGIDTINFRAMVYETETLPESLVKQLSDVKVVTARMFKNFLNLAGARISALAQEIQGRFALARSA
jgi:nucleoside-diphosphate kinase